jgi:hypothetical protein
MQAVAHVCESMQVLMLSKKQWFSNRTEWIRCGLVACGSLSTVSSLLLLSGQGSTFRVENTAGGQFMAR